jgi:hypothetical protein
MWSFTHLLSSTILRSLSIPRADVTRVNPRNLSSWKVKQILDLNFNCTL